MVNIIRLKNYSFVVVLSLLVLSFVNINSSYGQNQRNPVLEFCTGTWCQWCPCGDSIIINDVLPNIPNAIILAYHGPNSPAYSEPFKTFYGNTIIGSLGLNAYPTGVIDRVSGIQSRGTWYSYLNSRLNQPATVEIEIVSRTYNPGTREFNATIDITALQNLSGQFNYNVILVEDEIVYGQTSNTTCTPGTTYVPGFVHEWLVRDMMNGALGTLVVNGTWNQGVTFTKNIQYTVPVPPSPAPDIVPDDCRIIVMVYKVGSPLNSNAEIQQAEQWPLIAPDYLATMTSEQSDFIGSTIAPAQYDASLVNEGLLPDTYYFSLTFDGPALWGQTYTTINGIHQIGEIDSLDLNPGDTTSVTVTVNPNSEIGFGKTKLEFWSKNAVSTFGSIDFRLATFGLDVLVVDDESEDYENYVTTALDNAGREYGIVSSTAIPAVTSDLYTIKSLIWLTGLTEPGLNDDEINALGFYLDFGGSLYLNGVDLAYQLADPQSPYYTPNTLAFFNNYLHSSYVKRNYYTLSVDGVSGDPVSEGFDQMKLFGGTGANNLGATSGKYPNEITPYDTNATATFTFWYSQGKVAGVRAKHFDGKVIFSTFGFESIAEDSNRIKLADRVVDWFLNSTVSVGDPENIQLIQHLELEQNYPNPFNPETQIKYALPVSENSQIATLVIYDQLGQKVKTLVDEIKPSGRYEVTWNGKNDNGELASSGIYFYHLKYGKNISVKKMILLR